ncbi:Hypothetical protein CINCED_3A003217 [Cinara cedri]|uniref:Uncharacterized protein n=1 Tax=Cinara cedri TaxID=506608 RepID=A0A5E4NAB6_9HEMI|nr:Hypothetical protein CINCED_3A003217 [Cinara cedri]
MNTNEEDAMLLIDWIDALNPPEFEEADGEFLDFPNPSWRSENAILHNLHLVNQILQIYMRHLDWLAQH